MDVPHNNNYSSPLDHFVSVFVNVNAEQLLTGCAVGLLDQMIGTLSNSLVLGDSIQSRLP